MRKSLLLLAVLGALGFALPAKAQTAKGEIYVGYLYSRTYVNSGAFDATGRSVAFPGNGGSANGQYNLNDYLSVFGYFNGSAISRQTIDFVGGGSARTNGGDILEYGGGPRLYVSRGRIAPFLEVGLGAATASSSLEFNGDKSTTKFEIRSGGGVDIHLTDRISVRPGEIDYVATKFHDGINNVQSGWAYTGGVIIRFGSK